MKKGKKIVLAGMAIIAMVFFGSLVVSCASMSDEDAYNLGYAIGSSIN
jgi:hypothetical protein